MNINNSQNIENHKEIEYCGKALKFSYLSVILSLLSGVFLIFTTIPAIYFAIRALWLFSGNTSKEAIAGKRMAIVGLFLAIVFLYYSIFISNFLFSEFVLK